MTTTAKQRIPLFTAVEVRRVLRAGFRVSCETPTGIVARVDDAQTLYTRDEERVRVGPDRVYGERMRVRAHYPGGLFGRKQWCRPVRVWVEEP